MLNFNFEPGQELPVHSHEADSEVALLILEGEGVFTGGPQEVPFRAGGPGDHAGKRTPRPQGRDPGAPAGHHRLPTL